MSRNFIYKFLWFSGYYAHSQEHESLPAHSFSVFNIIWLSLFLIFVVFIVIFIYYRSKNRLFTYQGWFICCRNKCKTYNDITYLYLIIIYLSILLQLIIIKKINSKYVHWVVNMHNKFIWMEQCNTEWMHRKNMDQPRPFYWNKFC